MGKDSISKNWKPFQEATTIDENISQRLKEFLEGQPLIDGGTFLLSNKIMNAETVILIAQDAAENVLSFDFV